MATARLRLLAFAALATALVPETALAQTDALPPASGSVGELKRDPASGRLVPAEPPAATAPAPANATRAVQPPLPRLDTVHLCPDPALDNDCTTGSLQEALDRVAEGGTVVIHAGNYRQAAYVRRNGTHIIARDGATLVGTAAGGKGALVVQANDVVIEGLRCARIAVPSQNGACVRHEGGDLTLRGVHFHDSEEGVLAGRGTGAILIEGSRFENLGKAGQAHGIYAAGSALTIRDSLFLSSRDEGHEIKSRAASTLIENNVVASLDGNDSYLIDIPDGGDAIIRGNVLQEGPKSVNESAIAYGLEGLKNEPLSLTVTGNLFLVTKPNTRLVRARGTNARFEGNVIVGSRWHYTQGNVTATCGERGNVCATRLDAVRDAVAALPFPGILDALQRVGLAE